MSTTRSIILPLLLAASVLSVLNAECIPITQKTLLTNKVMKRSADFGIPSDSLACMAATLHALSADPETDPPCYDEARLAKSFTEAVLDCITTLPPGPGEHPQRPASASDASPNMATFSTTAQDSPRVRESTLKTLHENNGPHVRKSAQEIKGKLERQADEALKRIAERNNSGPSGPYERCVWKALRRGLSFQRAQRRCIGLQGSSISDSCHCFSGCHFCCVFEGIGGSDGCIRSFCPGGISCN